MTNTSSKELFQEAYELHQLGKLTSAAKLYNNILKEQPDNINVIFLTGTLNLQQRNFEVACIFFRKVLELNPDYAMVHCNLGTALHESGRIDEAIKCYKKAIALKPNFIDTYFNLGNALKEQSKIEEAVICYRRAIELKPNDADLYSNLGNTLREHGKLDEAVECYKKASGLNPDNAGFHCNLGAALQESGELDGAIASYKEAVKLDPNYAMAFGNLGSALQKSGKLNEAIASYKKAIAIKPDYAEAHNNLGISLLEKGEPEEAITCHKKAIELEPDCAEAYNNLGTALMEQGKFDAAIISHKKAIELKPDYAEAYNNLGTVQKGSGKPLDAIAYYEQAIELKPDYPLAHLNMAFALLLTENFKKGWQEYEWRLRIKGRTPKTSQKPVWDGSSLNGKSILVYTEQGLGDSIQFIRYLPMVKAQGGRVIVECQQSLCRLLKNSYGIDEVIEMTSNVESPIQFDVHVPLLSLPGIFNATMDSIPPNVPYIKSDPVLVSQWRAKLDYDDNFKVGIVWAGNPKHKNDRNRSCSLKDIVHLASIRELTFYSLQKGQASIAANNPPNGMKIINLTNELNDFADTAAAIDNLDLVISVDTSVAHLAGAIGKPVWTLLPFVPDWRWFLKCSNSPWYPSMRLFRQNKLNDWKGVLDQVKKALISDFGLQKRTAC